ncbi:hypothetical protein EVU96_25045 [Bacillus infantis]|uniref:hypothetical protein n=1 Tax=Bacillus infantis TaxID=324767 RepID=UPI00101C5C81|nr:hypothetical protein [Bacillus infantis]RYI25083.1 hypothetical protein EVU96_25045 [Bacillus infantis]
MLVNLSKMQILKLENWAAKKRRMGITSAEEKFIVESVEHYKRHKWEGIRADSEYFPIEKLMELK